MSRWYVYYQQGQNSNDAILSDTNEVSLESVNIENNDTTISSDNSVEKTESVPFAIEAAKLDVLNWHFYLTLRKLRGILMVRKSKLCKYY